MWRGRHVVLGVTGGIAAYKCVQLARDLTVRGARVDVVLTRGAGEFVGAATFEAVTRRPVRRSLWEPGTALDHVILGEQADLVIVAPATAHLLARAAAGIADDLLTSLLLATRRPVLLAPGSDDEKYAHPDTQPNGTWYARISGNPSASSPATDRSTTPRCWSPPDRPARASTRSG